MLARRPTRKAFQRGETACAFASWCEDPPDFDPYSDLEIPDVPSETAGAVSIPRDGYVDLAKLELLRLFEGESESVFYQRQLQVMFEKEFFHWVTVRALTELVGEGKIAVEVVQLQPERGTGTGTIVFYRSTTYRYWKRDADEVMKLVSRFSEPSFTSALGAQGEAMFDAALPRVGFMPTGIKVRSYGGVDWTKTNHDLVWLVFSGGV